MKTRLNWAREKNCYGNTTTITKVVALSMQMLDRKPNEEPEMMVEEDAPEYEANSLPA